MKTIKVIAYIIELIAVAICGAWAWDEYQTGGSVFEPIAVVLFAVAAMITIYLFGGAVNTKKPGDTHEKIKSADLQGDLVQVGRDYNRGEYIGRDKTGGDRIQVDKVEVHHHHHSSTHQNSSDAATAYPKILGSRDRRKNPVGLVGRKGELIKLREVLEEEGQVALVNGMGVSAKPLWLRSMCTSTSMPMTMYCG